MNPSPNVPDAKAPIAAALRAVDRRCQRLSASCSSCGELLAPPLLAQRAAGADAEVEVVEDLGTVFCHELPIYSLVRL